MRQIRQHIHPIGARVKAVEDAGEDEQREKRGHQINRLGVVMQQCFAHRQLQKRHAQHNGVQPHAQNLVQHIPVQHRFVPSFGRFVHIRGQRRLARKCQPRQRIHNHIDPQHLHHRHRCIHPDKGTDHRDTDGAQVHGQLENDKFANAFENSATIQNGFGDGTEIVVQNHNVARLFGDFGAAAHRKSDIRFFQRGRVVDAVAGHAGDQLHLLCQPYQAAFVARQRPCNHPQAG